MKFTLRQIFRQVNHLVEMGLIGETQDFLNEIGAVMVNRGCFSQAYILATKWGEVVIKYSDNCENKPVNRLFASARKEFPYLWKRYLKPLFASDYVVIQPKAILRDSSSNKKRFAELGYRLGSKLHKLYGCDFDSHFGNIGMYRGKMMIFDPLYSDQSVPNSNSSHSYESES